MSESTVLKTRIKLLYKTWSEWDAIKTTFIPLKGEVCLVSIPEEAHVFPADPALMFKVGQAEIVSEVPIGPVFEDLPWASAKAADVYAWAKKENLDFDDLDTDFKAKLIEYVESEIEIVDTQYRLNNDADEHIWKLQKTTVKNPTEADWVDTGTAVNIKAVITRMNDLETSLSTVSGRVTTVENWLSENGPLTEAEIKEICPAEV